MTPLSTYSTYTLHEKVLKPHRVRARPTSLPSLHPGKGVFSWGSSQPSASLSPTSPPSHTHTPWLLTAGRAPSARPTSLHRYFLRKTYHLRLDRSADYAEAAAAPAHNPPQASTSLPPFSLSLSSLLFSVSLLSLFHSFFPFFPVSGCCFISHLPPLLFSPAPGLPRNRNSLHATDGK